MLKHLHIFLVSLMFISFTGRVILAELNSRRIQQKWLNVTPHVIDSFVLLTGIALIAQGHWLDADYSWLVAKMVILVAYIGLGRLALRKQGQHTRLAAGAAIICLVCMATIAVNKKIFAFF